jgi:L-malate glycosyltransferase
MNILHITTFLQGGAGRILADMACVQKSRGNNVIIVTDDNPVDGYQTYPRYQEKLKDYEIDLLTVEALFRRDLALNIQAAKYIRNIIEMQEISIIHAHSAIPAFAGLIARSSSCHFVPLLMSMQGFGEKKSPDQVKTDVVTMNMVDKVVPVSHASAEHLVSIGVNPVQLKVIHNAIPEKEIEKVSAQRAEEDWLWKRMEGWRRHKIPILGCIGTICRRKNQSCLVKALRTIKDYNFRCLLIGEEEEPGMMAALIKSYGLDDKVVITGYRNDAQALLARLTCLILPSLSEGLPLAIIEAFREGIPVIGSNIQSIAELIINEKTGILFRSNEHDELAGELIKVIDNSREWDVLAQNGHDMFIENFTIDKMMKKYGCLYYSLIENNSLIK